MIKIDENDLNKINSSFKKLDELATKKAIAKLADDVFARAFSYADKHTVTGEMIESLYNKRISSSEYEIGSDLNKAPYALFVHFGSRPHTIRPKDRKALRWSKGGKWVFSKWANHPGYRGDEFLYNALKDELPKFSKWLDAKINKI